MVLFIFSGLRGLESGWTMRLTISLPVELLSWRTPVTGPYSPYLIKFYLYIDSTNISH